MNVILKIVSDIQKKIFKEVRKNQDLTYIGLARTLNISVATIKRGLQNLKSLGYIAR